MSTTRIFGNNPFEVFLKPTNKIEISISPGSPGASTFTKGTVVAYNKDGNIVKADASDRYLSSVLGIVTDTVSGKYTVVTQGMIPSGDVTPNGVNSSQSGEVWFLTRGIHLWPTTTWGYRNRLGPHLHAARRSDITS